MDRALQVPAIPQHRQLRERDFAAKRKSFDFAAKFSREISRENFALRNFARNDQISQCHFARNFAANFAAKFRCEIRCETRFAAKKLIEKIRGRAAR